MGFGDELRVCCLVRGRDLTTDDASVLLVLSEPGEACPGEKGLGLVREDFSKVLVLELEGRVGPGEMAFR